MAESRSSEASTRKSSGSRLSTLLPRLAVRLAFDESYESRFRPWYTEQTRTRIRNSMWIAMGMLLVVMLAGGPFGTMRNTVFGDKNPVLIDVLRFGFIVPSSLAILVVSYSSLYQRWFRVTTQIVAPIYALSFVAMDILMHPQGYSLSSWMPLVALAPFFLFWMPHTQAVCTTLMVVIGYAIGGQLAGLHGPQRYFDLAVIAFASTIGAIVHHSLQRSARRSYLAAQVLSESANRDSLTGIHNRRMFDEQMQRVWQQAMRERVPLALLLIDLDHFKAYNDHSGHQAGDACLVKVADVLRTAARRPLDLVARYGGEEFAALLYDTPRENVEEICQQLHATLSQTAVPHPTSPVSELVTISIGAACIEPGIGRQPEGFIQLADEALYSAKEQGRNRTIVMDREYESLVTGSFRSGRHEAA